MSILAIFFLIFGILAITIVEAAFLLIFGVIVFILIIGLIVWLKEVVEPKNEAKALEIKNKALEAKTTGNKIKETKEKFEGKKQKALYCRFCGAPLEIGENSCQFCGMTWTYE
jgi:hypothetical protein